MIIFFHRYCSVEADERIDRTQHAADEQCDTLRAHFQRRHFALNIWTKHILNIILYGYTKQICGKYKESTNELFFSSIANTHFWKRPSRYSVGSQWCGKEACGASILTVKSTTKQLGVQTRILANWSTGVGHLEGPRFEMKNKKTLCRITVFEN